MIGAVLFGFIAGSGLTLICVDAVKINKLEEEQRNGDEKR